MTDDSKNMQPKYQQYYRSQRKRMIARQLGILERRQQWHIDFSDLLDNMDIKYQCHVEHGGNHSCILIVPTLHCLCSWASAHAVC